MNPLDSLIRESLNQKPIGQSDNFVWFITDIGIAALMKDQNQCISSLDPIKEATELDLDLSKEEKQIVRLEEKQILLFYS
tara:strand:- start:171 stop:410 length:240 start_codon:yes stop_codon:yes gene_type:complete